MSAWDIISNILCVLSAVSFPVALIIWIALLIKEKVKEKIQEQVDKQIRLYRMEYCALKLMCHALERENEALKAAFSEYTEVLKDEYLPIISGYFSDNEKETEKELNRLLCEMTDEFYKEAIKRLERHFTR